MQADSGDKKSELSSPRIRSQTLSVIADIKSRRTEKEKRACRTRYGVGIGDNPFLDLPIDLHRYEVFS